MRPIYAGNGLATVSVAPAFQQLIMGTVSLCALLLLLHACMGVCVFLAVHCSIVDADGVELGLSARQPSPHILASPM